MKLKKIVSAALAGAMLAGTALVGVTAADEKLPFSDVGAKKWYRSAVEAVYGEGIMTGKSDTVFDPEANITRAEVVTAFARVACTSTEGYGDELSFTDTKTGKWYSDAVGWAADNNIIKGRGDGRFSPNDLITRAEIASILVNFINYMELELPDNAKVEKFADAGTFDSWMKAPIEAVRKNGLMQGDDGMFNPENTATRAEVAKVIANLLPYVGRVDVVEDGKSGYVIVKGSELAADAANRMQYQIEYTTGVKLDIVESSDSAKQIVLGGSDIDKTDLGADGYEIKLDGEKVIIDGDTAEGIYKGAVRFMKAHTFDDTVKFAVNAADRYEFEYPIGKLTINGNDIEKYKVVYPAGASENTMLGVNDLAEYIEKTTGYDITTAVGTTGDYAIIVKEDTVKIDGSANENLDNFAVKSEGNSIVITGSADRGAMYGCYDFLEQCLGWRFLMEDVDYLRPVEKVDLKGIDYEEGSIFENRMVYADTFLTSAVAQRKNKLIEGRTYTGSMCHTFDALDGEFSTQYENQPCLTNPDVFELMLKNVMTLLENNPNARLISVSQNDNTNYCDCDDCMESYAKYTKDPDDPVAGGTAGQMLEFVNNIAAEVKKEYPDVLIHTFAYQYTRHAPKGIEPAENVMIQLCSIECCFNHPLKDSPYCNGDFTQDIEEWASIADTLYIWDYNNNFAYRATPFPNLTYDVLAGNMELFADNNVKGLFLQGNGGLGENGEFDRLRWYLESKLAWDPYLTEDEYNAYMVDFMEGFYGEGWEIVYEALTLFHENYDSCVGVYDSPNDNWMAFLMKDYAKELVDLMDEAELRTESKEQFENIDCSQIQFDYLYLGAFFDTWYNSGDSALRLQAVNGGFALQEKMQKYKVRYSDAYPSPQLTDITKPPYDWKGLMDEQMFGE